MTEFALDSAFFGGGKADFAEARFATAADLAQRADHNGATWRHLMRFVHRLLWVDPDPSSRLKAKLCKLFTGLGDFRQGRHLFGSRFWGENGGLLGDPPKSARQK